MGDKSDNIPGVPGVGEKTALKLIKQFGSLQKLMENLDSVAPAKLRGKLREYEDQVWMSFKLAEIQRDFDLDVEINHCRFTEPDYKKLLDIFEKLEFRRLTKEVLEDMKNNAEIDLEKENIPEFFVPENADKLESFVESLILKGRQALPLFT